MSEQKQLETSNSTAEVTSAEDYNLQINLKLRLDEVADVEAIELRRKARRPPTRKELCRLACHIYEARRTRDRMLGRKLFGEPAWDMMLALYCLPARGERLTVTALTLAADCPQATGLRWQTILEKAGLIERGPHGIDARKVMVRLTAVGRKLLEGFLTRLFYFDTPIPAYPERAGGLRRKLRR